MSVLLGEFYVLHRNLAIRSEKLN